MLFSQLQPFETPGLSRVIDSHIAVGKFWKRQNYIQKYILDYIFHNTIYI